MEKEETQTLEHGYRNHGKHHFRQRCHSLLLSARGVEVKQIAELCSVRTRTVYFWMDRWEQMGLGGLSIQPGRGLKAALRVEDAGLVSLLKKSTDACAEPQAPVCRVG